MALSLLLLFSPFFVHSIQLLYVLSDLYILISFNSILFILYLKKKYKKIVHIQKKFLFLFGFHSG